MSRSRHRNNYRDLIHTLHQRYHQQWERAEHLEQELALVRGRWLGSLLACLLHLKRCLRPLRRPAPDIPAGPATILDEPTGAVSGKVSIIIPLKDRLELLRGCLRTLRKSSHRDIEIILVDNGSTQRRTARYLRHLQARGSARVVDCPGPFNFSWLCNEGAKQATGDYVLFLNNDTEVHTHDWLEHLIRLADRPDVGIVGATLLYPDGSIQHAGLFPRGDGKWIHGWRYCLANDPGHPELRHIRAVPAVSGACLMMRRDRFVAVGGFDERLPLTYNDVDLCQRVRQQQLLVVVTPHARLLHFECLSRGFSGDEPGSDHLSAIERFPAEVESGAR